MTRDDEVRLAHAQHVDQLADTLKAAEVGAVVDDLLGKCFGETGDAFELLATPGP